MEKLKSIEEIRAHFPALEQSVNGKPLIYLDNAATAQKPYCVSELVNEMNTRINGNIHRAVHELSARSTELYEGARDAVKHLVNAREREEIIFTSGTTASINLLAYTLSSMSLKKGDAVLISESEHHSNIVPWQIVCNTYGAQLRVLPIDENGLWRVDLLDRYLDSSVKIVSVAHISNVLGIINPIKEVIAKAKQVGAITVIDGAQGVVHTKIDVQDLGCDFYVFSGHKLYGPTGTGVLVGRREILEMMPPWMGGGDMVESVSFQKTTYAQIPLKFEAGTPNFTGASALGVAVKFIESLDAEVVENHEREIKDFVFEQLIKIDGVRIYGDNSINKIPLFSFTVDKAHPSDIAMIMDKMGVALRSGMMCCEPIMKRFKTESMLRASFAVYNTLDEAQLFISSLKRAINMLK